MNDNEFNCAMCKQVFEKGRSDEEALGEMEGFFGPVPVEDRAVICDDCFNQMHPDDHPDLVQRAREELGN